jgi:ribosomal-protein-alanine N-acetyltransferase
MPHIEATIAHAPVLAAMLAVAFPGDPWEAGTFVSLLTQPGMSAVIDDRGGFLVLRTILDEAEIITLGVTAPRQGIARGLMHAAITRAAGQGVTKIHLEVAEQNHPACALYAELGFIQTGRRRAYYADGTSALTLTLEIQQKK